MDDYKTTPFAIEMNTLKNNKSNENNIPIDNKNLNNPISKEQSENNIIQSSNKRDQQIQIKFNCCSSAYFVFGKTLFFYFPMCFKCSDVSSEYHTNTIYLSKVPDPHFSIGQESKFSYFIFKVKIL